MKHKVTLLLASLILVGIIPTYAATRSKSDPKAQTAVAESKAEKSVVKKKTQPAKAEPSAASKKLAADLTTTQKTKLLTLLNEGVEKDLTSINGIAKAKSVSIVDSRPFAKIEEISLVKGIGKATFEKIILHGKSLTQRKSSTSKKS